MPVFHTKTIESILEPVAQQVSLGKHPPLAGLAVTGAQLSLCSWEAGEGAIVGGAVSGRIIRYSVFVSLFCNTRERVYEPISS